MTREIKFRAFDKKDNSMREPWNPFISQIQASEIADKLCAWRFIKQEETHNYIFMQYIWLKDKNWKEIYEWDIIKTIWNWGRRIDYHMIEYAYIWYNPRMSCEIYEWDSMEVIWNIYEDPNLLDSKQNNND